MDARSLAILPMTDGALKTYISKGLANDDINSERAKEKPSW